ncbi:MAG: SBBP repeat-containing protein [Promethearchaeota archaeon]
MGYIQGFSCPPSPSIEWKKTWGGYSDEIMYEMVVDSTGFFYMAGETWSYGNGSSDLFIVKINETHTQYTTWGGPESEEFSGMVIDSNDKVYITGSTSSYGAGEKDVVLLKYNTSLGLEWYSIWGYNGSDSSSRIALDSLDNIYIAGITNSPYYDIFLIKYDSNGSLQWNYTWSTKNPNITEEVLSLEIDTSDHIFLGVNTNITGSEWFLLKYDMSGTLLLNKSYNRYLPIELLVLDSSDNLYAVGSYKNIYLSKFNNNGNLEWNLTCIQNSIEATELLAIDPSDNIYISGTELINPSVIIHGYNITDYDTYLMKFNNSGILKWNRTLIGDNNRFPEILTFDFLGNLFLGGSTELIATKELDVFVRVFDSSGNPIKEIGGGGEGDAYCKGIYAESPQSFFAAENFENWDYEIMLTKYIEPENYCPPFFNLAYQIMRIIFNGLFYISLLIGVIYLIIQRKTRVNH